MLLVAPPLLRHRACRNVQGFLRGVYGAAIGDRLTALIAAGGLAALIGFGIGNAMLVGIAATFGLAAFPLLYPEWMLAR